METISINCPKCKVLLDVQPPRHSIACICTNCKTKLLLKHEYYGIYNEHSLYTVNLETDIHYKEVSRIFGVIKTKRHFNISNN